MWGLRRGSVPHAGGRFGVRVLRAPPAATLCWARAAARRGGDPGDAEETRPGSGVDSGRPGGGWAESRCGGRLRGGRGGVRAPGPAQLGGLKSGRRDLAPCPGWAAGLRVGGAYGFG